MLKPHSWLFVNMLFCLCQRETIFPWHHLAASGQNRASRDEFLCVAMVRVDLNLLLLLSFRWRIWPSFWIPVASELSALKTFTAESLRLAMEVNYLMNFEGPMCPHTKCVLMTFNGFKTVETLPNLEFWKCTFLFPFSPSVLMLD